LRTPSERRYDTGMNGHGECPVNAFQQMISGKYKLRLIWDLQHRPLRYGELKRNLAALPGNHAITARTLSRELKSLTASGLITRHDHGTVPPSVDYALTGRGRSLLPLIASMQDWGIEHLLSAAAAAAV